MKTKLFFTFLSLLLLNGCSSHNTFYILSTASSPKTVYPLKSSIVGVESIVVPRYLFKREIAIAISSHEVDFLADASWAEDLNEGLTRRLINFLQKKFQLGSIYHYPWNLSQAADFKVTVHISRFIFLDGFVYLEADWQVYKAIKSQSFSKLSSIKIPTLNNKNSIVRAMDLAFAELEVEIADTLIRVSD